MTNEFKSSKFDCRNNKYCVSYVATEQAKVNLKIANWCCFRS